jgi:dTDP-4-amino-4,6-dideoxygalactose transaminase
MSNITASIGNSHISGYKEFTLRRNEIAKKYTENLSEKFEKVLPEGESGWYKYIVYLPKDVKKSEFKNKCKDQGLGLPGGVYDLPLHLQPVLENLNLKNKLEVSEEVCERHVCLPIYPNMTNAEVEKSLEILNKTI